MARILHFSDVHFPLTFGKMSFGEMLHPKRQLAALNYFLRRRSHFCDADTKWTAFCEFIESQSFDAIICTGDLTGMGMQKELQHARAQLQNLLARPDFILLPGNHDVYLPGSDAMKFYNTFAPHTDKANIIPCASGSRYPFAQLIDKSTAVLAINSAKPNPMFWRSSGRISEASLDAARQLLEHDELRNRRVIVATHYNIDDNDSPLHGMENRQAVREAFNNTPAVAFIHGHIHRKRHEQIDGFSVPVFCAGSLTYTHRENFWVYDISDSCTATPGTWNGREYICNPEESISFEATT